jgi:phage-related baseplate assembly protein
LKNQVTQTPNTTYSQYGKSKQNKRTMYKITGTEVYAVSTPIKLKTRNRASGEDVENDYFVIESKIYNEGNTLKCGYTLGKQTDYFVDPIPHEKIRGAVIEARTVHIARTDESKSKHGRTDGSSDNLEGRTTGAKPLNKYIEKAENQNENVKEKVKASDIAVMTLDLTEGLLKLGENGQSFEDKYAGKSYFPYVTPYSQTNTGFTPAPEVNDRVALYFPNGNETHAIVLGAVNNDGNGRFTDVANRNYHVGDSDFNMILAKDKLSTIAESSISHTSKNISENADTIFESAKNIVNISDEYLEIIEKEKMIIASDISQVAQNKTNIISNGDTEITSDGFSVINGGTNVLLNK